MIFSQLKHYRAAKVNHSILLILLLFSFSFISCEKDPEPIPPNIQLKTGGNYISSDTTFALSENFLIGINAEKGSENLTNFIIMVRNPEKQRLLDTGFNTPSLNLNRMLTKGLAEQEEWIFIIRDKKGNSASVSFIVNKSSLNVFGPVKHYPSITLGAQNNTSLHSFLSLWNGNIYPLNQAFAIQDSIDLLYYYDFFDGDDNTISSPGANIDVSVFPGSNGINNWVQRNETRFKEITLSASEFDQIANDSLLIAAYGITQGKRKAKQLAPGKTFAFQTQSGRNGIFRVLNVSGTDQGSVEIELKVQEN